MIVTENEVDFRKLIAREDVHPDLILLPSVGRDFLLRLLMNAIAYLVSRGEPSDVIVNHVLEVIEAGAFTLSPLPE